MPINVELIETMYFIGWNVTEIETNIWYIVAYFSSSKIVAQSCDKIGIQMKLEKNENSGSIEIGYSSLI